MDRRRCSRVAVAQLCRLRTGPLRPLVRRMARKGDDMKASFAGALLVASFGCGDDGSGGSTFDLAFSGTDYAPHNGMNLKVRVFDTADNSLVQSDMVTVAGGAVSFNWPDVLESGHSYAV